MIGLGTYAFFWQHSARAPQPLDLAGMLRQTHELNGEVFQICDYPPIQDCSGNELRYLRELAGELGIVLELGTKGIGTAHLDSYLRLAESLGVRLVRSMVNTQDHRPRLTEAEHLLRTAMSAYESAGVSLALETYEQLSSSDLVTLVEAYEAKHFPIDLPDPVEAIKFRMEQAGLAPKDLVPAIGRLNRVYEILNHKRPLTLNMIWRLHEKFGIPAESLIRPSKLSAAA